MYKSNFRGSSYIIVPSTEPERPEEKSPAQAQAQAAS